MKHIFKLSVVSILLILMGACSNSDFSEKYPDPSKTTDASIETLMTGTFEKGNLYTMPWYRRYYTYEIPNIGRYTQIMGWVNRINMYTPNDVYTTHRWDFFYQTLSQYRTMEAKFNELPEDRKSDYEVFIMVTKVFIYDHLQQLVDVWGDIPFTKAGYLPINSNIEASKAAYDKDTDLYTLMLNDLKAINTYLANTSLSELTQTMLKNQDYINYGNITMWRKYCNSLRLRMALRIAEQGSMTETGKSVIQEILADPSTYPLVENNSENILINYAGNNITAMEGQHEQGIRGGFESTSGYYNRASKAMIDALQGDPRMDVIYDKNIVGEYVGLDPLMVESSQDKLFEDKMISAIDTATFSRNNKFPGIIITASEVAFMKAEIYQKFGVQGDVKASFIHGVTQSVDFYYYLNSLGNYREPLPSPSDSEMRSFAEEKWDEATDIEETILFQKWLHFGPTQMVQAWADLRRTGYPKLQFQSDSSSPTAKNPVNRFRYPVSEKTNNAANFEAVKNKDNYDDKMFWAE